MGCFDVARNVCQAPPDLQPVHMHLEHYPNELGAIRAWQTLHATSSSHKSSPRLLTSVASYDVARNMPGPTVHG